MIETGNCEKRPAATVTHIRSVVELTSTERDGLFQLMQRCYDGVCREAFERDLSEKQWVIVVSDAEGIPRGFSTQMLIPSLDFPEVDALFSGDTIVDPAWWNQHDMSGVWGQLALSLIDREPNRRLVWFLISKGYKTYRYLPLFFHEFYPRFDQSTPIEYQRLINSFGEQKFGQRFNSNCGIVRAGPDDYRLRAEVAPLQANRLRSPHVRFFVANNPGYATGDELCCVAALTRSNFTSAAYRVIAAADRGCTCYLD